jgi:hypothetical protein
MMRKELRANLESILHPPSEPNIGSMCANALAAPHATTLPKSFPLFTSASTVLPNC